MRGRLKDTETNMAESALSRDQIIEKFGELQKSGTTYSVIMQGLKLLNPRFAEIEKIIASQSAPMGNPIEDIFEKAFNENPKFLETLIAMSGDNSKIDDFAGLLKTAQGRKIVIDILTAASGNKSLDIMSTSLETPTTPQFEAATRSGLVALATGVGLEVRPNPVDTPEKALNLLSTLALPVVAARGIPLLTSAFRARPITTGLLTADAISLAVPSGDDDKAEKKDDIVADAGTEVVTTAAADPKRTGLAKFFNELGLGDMKLEDLAGPALAIATVGAIAYSLFTGNIGIALGMAATTLGIAAAYKHIPAFQALTNG